MTDQQLIDLYFARDERAVAETKEKYGAWCAAIAWRLLRDSRDVEECLSDCALAVWNAIPPQRPEHFKGWLGAIVRNRGHRPWPGQRPLAGHSGRGGVGAGRLPVRRGKPPGEGGGRRAGAGHLRFPAHTEARGRGRPSSGGIGTPRAWRRWPATWAGA